MEDAASNEILSAARLESVDLIGSSNPSREDKEEEKKTAADGGSRWWISSLIVVNAAMGAGMLNFPAAFDAAGGIAAAMGVHAALVLVAASSLLVLGWCADGASVSHPPLLLDLDDDHGEAPPPAVSQSYQETIRRICGRSFGNTCSVIIAVYMFLASVTYLVVVGDQSDKIFYDQVSQDFCRTWYLNRKFVIAAGSIVLVWPLCYAKKIDFLKYASAVATIGIAYVVVIVVYVFFTTDKTDVVVRTSPESWTDIFNVIPAICFAYQCHVSSIPVYACIRPHTLGSFTKTISGALAICFFCYSLIGILGYLTFGVGVDPDILSQYSTDDWPVALGFVLFGLKNLLTFPILLFCGRLALNDVWTEVFGAAEEGRAELRRRATMVTLWFLGALGLAVFLPNITAVVDYLGCLAALFIFPGLCLLCAALREDSAARLSPKTLGAGAAGFLIFGSFLAGLILTQAIQAQKPSKNALCVA